jgi:hypothetical protein
MQSAKGELRGQADTNLRCSRPGGQAFGHQISASFRDVRAARATARRPCSPAGRCSAPCADAIR